MMSYGKRYEEILKDELYEVKNLILKEEYELVILEESENTNQKLMK